MNLYLIVETKDSMEGLFKALPESYTLKTYNEAGKDVDYISHNFNSPYYVDRDNNVFAMLANVENDKKLETIFDPVFSIPRGIPVDASSVYLRLVEQFYGNVFKASYYYLRELKLIKNSGYWDLTYEDKKYSEIGYRLLNLITNLELLETEKNICHNCVRICFFFN